MAVLDGGSAHGRAAGSPLAVPTTRSRPRLRRSPYPGAPSLDGVEGTCGCVNEVVGLAGTWPLSRAGADPALAPPAAPCLAPPGLRRGPATSTSRRRSKAANARSVDTPIASAQIAEILRDLTANLNVASLVQGKGID